MQLATGDIVHILNADDMYAAPNSVSSVMARMKAQQLELCHGYAEQIDSAGKVVKRIGKNIDRKELLGKMRAAHPAIFVAKSVYRKFGMYSVGFKVAADHDFLLRIWDKVKIGFVPETIVKMRIGGVSTSQFVLSYRESMAAAIINGRHPFTAYMRYNYEIVKNTLLYLLK